MSNDLNQVRAAQIGVLIHIVRGQRVMLDSDLAMLEPPLKEEKRREMGFHMKEEARKYRVRNGA